MKAVVSHAVPGRVGDRVARFGLAARAVIYLLVGWLAIQIALGQGQRQANQRGALADVAGRPFGVALLAVLGAGLGAYSLWRLSEALLGVGPGDGAADRVRALVSGVVYAALCASAFEFVAGRSQQGQSQQQATLTARVMRHGGGRWLVGVIGAVVVVVGVGMIVEAARGRFQERLRTGEMPVRSRQLVRWLGTAGGVARGLALVLAGALVLDAAATFDPAKSTGLDGALRTLADRAYGPELLGAVAAGLVAFGLYCCAEARWVRT
ncbi:DUF1206 domain-containing protein [Acidiferrimicrobium sp. IK]|uniref:DUF1206 domain-containing protein n=1 Tax=Acidiferrimicrobium sp. IK TaxID=2871700 RepID=UPI0021CB6C78|nr:DUF1206 domain-containing protein [Acidiferrimicrobium sp. IK]MCU4186823.1 DUF1206 domain-containing protein [Acidiferrimicrobium sp. IK]